MSQNLNEKTWGIMVSERSCCCSLSCSRLDIVQPPSLQFTRLLVLNDSFINADWAVTLGSSSGQLCTVGIASTRDGNNGLPPGIQGGLSHFSSFCSGQSLIALLLSWWLQLCPVVISIPRETVSQCFLLLVVFFPSAEHRLSFWLSCVGNGVEWREDMPPLHRAHADCRGLEIKPSFWTFYGPLL